jgi:hypothetical protein
MTSRLVAILLVGILIAWTYERLSGDGDDPTIRATSESQTGYMSVLVSGSKAVALVVGALALITWPTPLRQPLVGAVLVGVVFVHWWIESEEVEDA